MDGFYLFGSSFLGKMEEVFYDDFLFFFLDDDFSEFEGSFLYIKYIFLMKLFYGFSVEIRCERREVVVFSFLKNMEFNFRYSRVSYRVDINNFKFESYRLLDIN